MDSFLKNKENKKPPFTGTLANGSRPLEINRIRWHTKDMTDGHCDLETESAQWANSVKIIHDEIFFFFSSIWIYVN